ncbi:MAG: HlyD family efflux transporter periplasmic adaptor subunit [Chloroflexota bacterium]
MTIPNRPSQPYYAKREERPKATPPAPQLPQILRTPPNESGQNIQYVIMPYPVQWGQPSQSPALTDQAAEKWDRQRRRRRNIFVLLFLFILSSALLFLYGTGQGTALVRSIFPPQPPVASEAEPIVPKPAIAEANPASTTGSQRLTSFVRPLRQANLGLPISGIIKEIYVTEGEWVEEGQTILALDNARQVVAVAQAHTTLEQITSRLEALQSGEKNQTIVAAEAAVDAAQARLDSLTADVKVEDETAAVAKLEAAQAALEDLLNGPDNSVLSEAQAELQNVESALRRAQNAYNAVKWRNDIAMLPESQILEQATIEHERAKARFEQATQGAGPAEISQAQARVSTAEAELERVLNPVSQNTIDAAEAELRQAQANLALAREENGSNVLTLAQAEMAHAKVAMLEAEVALEETKLVAPFSGVVGEFTVQLGEFVEPGQQLVRLGDIATWQIVADGLADMGTLSVAQGQLVTVTFPAIADLVLPGVITQIRQDEANQSTKSSHSIIVALSESDSRLSWNLAAEIAMGQ